MKQPVLSHLSPRTRLAGAAAFAVGMFGMVGLALADCPSQLPPEAYAACSGKAAADTCSLAIHGSELQGTCAPDHSDGKLFCRLNDPPPPPPSGR